MKRFLCLGAFLLALSSSAESVSLRPSSSPSHSLPISVQNEVDFAIENGRAFLRSLQSENGFWTFPQEAQSSLPAFAFLDPAVPSAHPEATLQRACHAALSRLLERAPFPQSKDALRSMAEDALVVMAAYSLYGDRLWDSLSVDFYALQALQTHLHPARRIHAPASTGWLCQSVLDLLPGKPADPVDWEPLFLPLRDRESPTVREVAIAGYARIRRGNGADSPAAIRAYLRWLRAQSSFSAEDAYYLCAFLNAAPDSLLLETGFSASWRTELAQRLIASAKVANSGCMWGTSEDHLFQTLFAVATLAIL